MPAVVSCQCGARVRLPESGTDVAVRCPRCKGIHLGRVKPGWEPGGKRRTPCGTVIVVIRSRYVPEVAA